MTEEAPKLLVFCSLFPSVVQPNAGVFIRERMFRVAKQIPIVVVSPVPWFPFQGIIRFWKPNYRPQPALFERQTDIKIYFPRFFSLPFFLRSFDGFFMALGSFYTLYKLRKKFNFNIIDAHFAYPDGFAATLLGRWFKVAVTITLRGTEVPLSKTPVHKERILSALKNAVKVFSVANSLKQHVISLGAEAEKIQVVGNGVDINKFKPVDKIFARKKLSIPDDAKVLISVGGLVNRKGFHRVIEVLPEVVKAYPGLIYLIVGGACPEGNIRHDLEQQVKLLKLEENVKFLGALPSEQLKTPLSAADVFVLATANEGWANVFLEAMACGLPVVTTNVGGNREVVCNDSLGQVIPFGDAEELQQALLSALHEGRWDKQKILDYATDNTWDNRVKKLTTEFSKIVNQ